MEHTLRPPTVNRRVFWITFAALVIVLLLIPSVAYAGFLDDVLDIEGTIKDWLKGAIESELNAFVAAMRGMSADQILSGGFSTLLSNASGGTSVYNIVHSVWNSTVVPLGSDILALCMLVQLVKISQKVDASATLPTVKELVMLAVFFIVFSFLVSHSFDICEALYNELNKITLAITGGQAFNKTAISIGNTDNMTIGNMIFMLLLSVIVFLLGVVAWMIALIVSYARAIQLYIMAAFSPIPLALLGFEETRSYGIGFLKNFVAVCLAGAIIVLLLICFPVLASTVDLTIPISGVDAAMNMGNLANASATDILSAWPFQVLKLAALALLTAFAIVKSGSWARDILGG